MRKLTYTRPLSAFTPLIPFTLKTSVTRSRIYSGLKTFSFSGDLTHNIVADLVKAGVVHVTKEDTQPTDRFVGGNEEALATTSGGHSKYSRID